MSCFGIHKSGGRGCVSKLQTQTFVAVAAQTTFELSSVPSGDVSLSRNGATISDTAATVAADVVTYVPAQNNGEVLLAGDRIDISYIVEDCSPGASASKNAPKDTVSLDAASNLLTEGTSAGNVNKPTNAPASLADVNDADDRLEVSYQSMEQLFTNRSQEPGAGMMNADGSLGHFASQAEAPPRTPITSLLDTNGTLVMMTGQDPVSGDVFTLGPPNYRGEIIYLNGPFVGQIGFYGEVVLRAGVGVGIGGVVRLPDHRVRWVPGGSDQRLILRGNEGLTLVADGAASWRVVSNSLSNFGGSGWYENEDGTATIWGSGYTAVFPILLANTNYRTASQSSNKTVTGFNNVGGGDWHIEGGLIDYAALGGIASF